MSDSPPDTPQESPKAADKATQPRSGIAGFFAELKRRKVMRVAGTYAVVAWLVIQIAASTFPSLLIPAWALSLVIMCVILGFPVAILLAWAFEMTPDGIRASSKAQEASPTATSKSSKGNWNSVILAALAPTLIFGALALFFYLRADKSEPAPIVSAQQTAKMSIAVLPLINMSANPENTFFAGGVHEDVLTNLSHIQNLQVTSRTTMLRYASSDLTLREIGEALGVQYVVEGSVRRIGNHVRVTIQLIDALNDLHIWANSFERELTNGFTTQTELAGEISNSIHLELQPETAKALQGMPTESALAYDLYQKSISLERSEGETQDATIKRRAMLEQAVEEDPEFVEAWGQLKRIYDLMASRADGRAWYLEEGEERTVEIQKLNSKSDYALSRAITLDPDNAETLLARAVNHSWPQSEEFMVEQRKLLDRVILEHPENAKAWYHLAWWYRHLTPRDQAKSEDAMDEALKRDPFNVRIVESALVINSDEKRIEELSDLLDEIIPETAEERLAKRTTSGPLFALLDAFCETADESYMEQYKAAFDAIPNERFNFRISQEAMESYFWAYSNELDRIIESAEKPWDLSNYTSIPLAIYYWLNERALILHRIAGRQTKANETAERILATIHTAPVEGPYSSIGWAQTQILKARAVAHAQLGDLERGRQMIMEEIDETLQMQPGPTRNSRFADNIRSLFTIDLDQGAKVFFAYPLGDRESAFMSKSMETLVESRAFLTHPKIMEYYIEDGRWLPYLSTRIPEYAAYK